MISRYLTGASLFTAALVSGVGTAHADALLEYTGANAACHAEFARLAMSGVRLRVETPPPMQNYSMIYDGAEKLAVSLDAEHHSYFEIEMDEDALDYQSDVMSSTSTMIDKKLAVAVPGGMPAITGANATAMPMPGTEQSAQMQALLQKNMEQMPKEQREQMQKALKDMQERGGSGFASAHSPPQTEVTDQTKTIAGIGCSVQRVTQNGALLQEECVAAFDGLGLQPAELKRLQKSLRNFDGLAGAMSKFRVAGISMPKQPSIERRGIVIERRCYANGRETGSTTLRMTRPSLSGSLFEIPAGYQRMDMSGLSRDSTN
jgi:hypothetical protein